MLDLRRWIDHRCWRPKKRSHFIALLICAGLMLWFFTGLFSFHQDAKEKVPILVPQVRVKTFTAQDHVPTLQMTGVTAENRTIKIRAETDGQIIDIKRQKGDLVDQGVVLVNLSLDTRRAKLAEAKALVEQRKLEFDVAKKLQKQSFRSRTNVADAKAKYESAIAALEGIKTSIKDTKIVAPFKGFMDRQFVEVGSYVKVGEPVVQLVDLNPVKVIASVSQDNLKFLTRGKKVKVKVAGFGPREGRVTHVSVMADTLTRTFPVEVMLDNGDYALKAGMTAAISVPKFSVAAHTIPASILVLNDHGLLGVHGVNAQNQVVFHGVRIIQHGKNALWVTGLPPVVRLILVGQDYVIPGQRVDPIGSISVPEEKAAAHATPS